jgi:hypothetical protein
MIPKPSFQDHYVGFGAVRYKPAAMYRSAGLIVQSASTAPMAMQIVLHKAKQDTLLWNLAFSAQPQPA